MNPARLNMVIPQRLGQVPTVGDETLGQRIRARRKSLPGDIKQNALARMIGVNAVTVWRYEKDETTPKTEILDRLAEALGTTSRWLLRGDEDEEEGSTVAAEPVLDVELSDIDWALMGVKKDLERNGLSPMTDDERRELERELTEVVQNIGPLESDRMVQTVKMRLQRMRSVALGKPPPPTRETTGPVTVKPSGKKRKPLRLDRKD